MWTWVEPENQPSSETSEISDSLTVALLTFPSSISGSNVNGCVSKARTMVISAGPTGSSTLNEPG